MQHLGIIAVLVDDKVGGYAASRFPSANAIQVITEAGGLARFCYREEFVLRAVGVTSANQTVFGFRQRIAVGVIGVGDAALLRPATIFIITVGTFVEFDDTALRSVKAHPNKTGQFNKKT
ncbi:hypothetical protein [Hahella sp. HN01]|uniref:hypothetical protein n=1 Tax=Hahella sp. HN01 TaxID=2847262 RepID=UPI0020A6731C|nr:hypothetical protein [Hahella sp. HN01]